MKEAYRRISRMVLPGFAQVGSRFLQQMLQEALLVDVDLIELVNVDEQKASQTAGLLPACS